MTAADRYLLRNGFNLDGSKAKKKQTRKRQLSTQILIADKKNIKWLREAKIALDNK